MDGLEPIFEQIRRLRDPDGGCPWDREQTVASCAEHILGEAEELAEALAAGDGPHIREEAGDLLWNLCFALHLAGEAALLDPREVVPEVVQKMVRRHPHVYGEVRAETSAEALRAFREAKAAEKGRTA